MLPYIPDSLEDIATELKDWMDGKGTNEKLDKWYSEYGEYFSSKTL
jgi:hypothetical protein